MLEVNDVVNIYKDTSTYEVLTTGTIVANTEIDGVLFHYVKVGDGHPIPFIASVLRKRYTHISPSGLKMFENNRDEFYMKYIARFKPPTIPQTKQMSVGSAFDARAKAFINKSLLGDKATSPEYEKYSYDNLFKVQVEEQNRPFAEPAGVECFKQYCKAGAMASLMLEIAQGDVHPQYEFDVKGLISHTVKLPAFESTEIASIPMAGKPDLYYKNKHGLDIIGDWKVNGYCSNSPSSPKPGYVMCRDGWDGQKQSRSHNCMHKDAIISTFMGMRVNNACNLEDVDKDWATQLSTYAWCLGQPIGGVFLVAIEQLCCSPGPCIRVASFRNFVGKVFQEEAYHRYYKCWSAIQSGYIYPELSRIDNDVKCHEMEKMAQTLNPSGNDDEDWFNNMNRRH